MEQFNSKDLIKFVSGITHLYPENIFFKNILKAVDKYPEVITEDWLSKGQVESKRWLVKELEVLSQDLGTIYLTPGWYGLLAQLISQENLNYKSIRSFDIDQRSVEISEFVNRNLIVENWKFKATKKDIFNINYLNHSYETIKNNGDLEILEESPDTIINTACEHIDYKFWLKNIPDNKMLVLQNNNYLEGRDHKYCVRSLEEFKENCRLSTYYYAGEFELNSYSRYMLIGRK